MVASVKTLENLYKVLRKHLDDRTINRIMTDLQKVQGNRSFNETIAALLKLHVEYLTNQEK